MGSVHGAQLRAVACGYHLYCSCVVFVDYSLNGGFEDFFKDGFDWKTLLKNSLIC